MTEKELEKIYNEAYKPVYWTAMQLLKNESDAEDIVQDTFISFMESYGDMDDLGKVVALLKKIAANKCLNRIKLTKTDNMDDEFFDSVEAVPEDFLPDSIVESEDARRIIMDIINNSLSEDIRRTLILFYFDEMSTREIAEALGVPEGTVRRRLNFARNKIKKEVEKYEEENKTKLFSMAALPFLSKLFIKEAAQVPFKAMPASLTATLSASAKASTHGAATKIAASAAKKGTGVIMNTKILIGSIAAVVVVGATVGIILGVISKKADTKPEKPDDVVIEDSEKSQDELLESLGSDTEPDMSETDNFENNYAFKMLVTNAEVVAGEGTLVTGDIGTSGVLRVGDKVKVVDNSLVYDEVHLLPSDIPFETVEATVISIQKDSEYVNEVSEGYDVVVMLDVEIHENILYSVHVVTDMPVYNTKIIVADLYTYPRQDGGKTDPFIEFYNPYFRFGSETLNGYFTFPSDLEIVMPGDYVEEIYINLEKDIDVEIGDEFEIVENGRVIGTGKITGMK